jgi:uncharacterized tellurite resistance protein B-like protein
MFKALKALLGDIAQTDEQPQLEGGVAALLFEMTRMDGESNDAELGLARAALVDLLGVSEARARELVDAAGAARNRLTSYYDAVALVNRHFTPERKIALVEYLWRMAYLDHDLDWQEDHLARKLSDLLYVPHVQCMLARQRAREGGRGPGQTS